MRSIIIVFIIYMVIVQGHASLFTGTFPKYHGMVNNNWLDANDNLYTSFQDNNLETSGVFDPTKVNTNGIYDTPNFYYTAGVSSKNYRADTVADQLIINQYQQETTVLCITQDPLTATAMSGQLRKVIWQDGNSGLFI